MTLRPGTVVLVALPPAVVGAVDPAGWFPFGPAKWLAVAALVPLSAAVLLAGRPLRVHLGVTVASVALVGWLAVAAVGGDDPLYAWTGTPERHFGVVTWVLCAVALLAGQCARVGGAEARALAVGSVVAGAGLGLVAAAEATGWEPAVLDVGHRLTGTFGSSAYLGAATTLLLPVCAGVAADRRVVPAGRAAASLAVVTLTVACVGSGARAAWFGLGLAAAATCWAQRRHLLAHRRQTAVGAVSLLVAGTLLLTLSPAGSRLADTFDEGGPGGRSRLDEWRVASRVVGAHPVAGVGPEGYRIAFGAAVDEGYERAHGRDPLPDRAHAAPLDVAVAGGVPALLAWAVVVAVGLRAAGRALGSDRAGLVGAGAALVAFAGNQLLLFPVAELEPLAWLLAGVVIAATAPPGRSPVRLAPRAVPVALAVVGLAGAVAATTELVADRHAARAAAALARGDPERAVAAADAATDVRPDVVRYHLLEARSLVAADRGTRPALAAVDAALDVSPRDPVALLDRLELLVTRASATRLPDDIARARRAARDLVGRDPNLAAAWLQAGAAHQLAGDEQAAITAWSRAEQLAPRSAAAPVDLALLHLEAGRIDEAMAAAERAVTIDPDDPRARQVLALVEQAR